MSRGERRGEGKEKTRRKIRHRLSFRGMRERKETWQSQVMISVSVREEDAFTHPRSTKERSLRN